MELTFSSHIMMNNDAKDMQDNSSQDWQENQDTLCMFPKNVIKRGIFPLSFKLFQLVLKLSDFNDRMLQYGCLF
jgi:hypothetical protein